MPQQNVQILENHSLKSYNTFGIDVKAKFFCEINSINQLSALFSTEHYSLSERQLILGGGSNILFTKDYDGIVVKMAIKGITIKRDIANSVFVSVGAGEIWHDLVLFCIENNIQGIENLSLIPGTVGAAPIQNIGAYGVEVKKMISRVEAINIKSGDRRTINRAEMKLGYRDSIFKNLFKDKFIITSVYFKFPKKHQYNISYGSIKDTLEKNGVKELSVKAISDAVVEIRKSKLPNPAEIGNAGSFFKNPTISSEKLKTLLSNYPTIPNYPADENSVKLAAGWLIEQCGWKGKRIGNTGVHKDQALVLVNYGDATGLEIWHLAQEIIKSVEAKFGITLAPEVNIL